MFALALRRAILWVVGFAIVGLVVGGLYLRFATKRHVAVAKVTIERLAPGLATGKAAEESLDAVIEVQSEILRSTDVLRLADANGDLGSLRTFAAGDALRDPVVEIRRDLRVDRTPGSATITVSYAAPDPSDAARVVDEVCRAYQSYQSDRSTRRSRELAGTIETQQRETREKLAAARRELAAFDSGGPLAGPPATQQVASLAQAMTTAQVDTFGARRLYDEALANAGPQLAGLDDKQLEETLAQAGASAPDSSELIAQEAAALGQQLTELRRTFAENHPAVARATARLKQIRLLQVASARQRWQAAQAREGDLRKALEQLQSTTSVQTARGVERDRLVAEANRLQAQADEIDRQLNQIVLATTAGSLNITVSDADVDHRDYPALPRTGPTLATAGLIGLVVGGLLALLGEFRSVGTLRHVVPSPRESSHSPSGDRAARQLGVPVLGSIPEADDADERSAPVAWAGQLDPFGTVANAVRTMRRSLEIEGKLPATIILTAAADGQGTTSLAMNLATTIAREGRKVLIADLNYANPNLARTLEIDGTRGLTELVADGDPLELIRTTSIARLDVLPAGAKPADSGAMLNDDRFLRLLTNLTSAYDHVIFDAAPLSRGDDARIVASVCDGTVLVSRPSPASLRRTAGARDLLLTVGANLLGVVLNRVGDSSRTNASQSITERNEGPSEESKA